jgi:hypothetical protein
MEYWLTAIKICSYVLGIPLYVLRKPCNRTDSVLGYFPMAACFQDSAGQHDVDLDLVVIVWRQS